MADSTTPDMQKPRRADDPTRFIPWLRDRNPSLARIPVRTIEALFEGAVSKKVKRDEVLQRQGQRADRAFVVISGTLALRLESNGVNRELLSYTTAEVASLLALVDQGPCPYEVRASVDGEVVAIDAWRLAQLCAAYHPSGVAMLDTFLPLLTEHLRQLDERCVRLAARKNASMRGSGQTVRRDGR